ncbi:hypothetical protein BU24DRAFT_258052 [Aaosphaeria arxii CBS 175.79]|uniref:Zn(2)-C6 fungal-type domain-containing protein n=1 Tax=Aaosphaeria arxii CBS 175.79 TaxID=1450172 RepID=A0A6A5XIU1_9PLEO|nr:uncharacterized protein BU24DRAFT_258052 [Aaosphaeria arxii CBS 175.79]KAF2012747.1 hypothetical protein BU24DRAFT_258052 [Aaosphaeria arxii CBS 175.79]
MGGEEGGASRKRTNNACLRCRSRKVKCSGDYPCSNCTRRSVECQFGPDEKKVVVSESYLLELERRCSLIESEERIVHPPAKRIRPSRSSFSDGSDYERNDNFRVDQSLLRASSAGRPSSNSQTLTDLPQPNEDESDYNEIRNPLVARTSNIVTDPVGRMRWLGPSSTWAYSRHVILMMWKHLGQYEENNTSPRVDAQAISLDWPSVCQIDTPTRASIPSFDHAKYLTSTVEFHLCQTYHLFDVAPFKVRLNELYRQEVSTVQKTSSNLWYIHFLLVMALGKALLAPVDVSDYPAGKDLFTQALELLPNAHGLYQDPLQSIEILCCLALYLQSVDHRNSAYLYIGQAVRIALSQGLHRERSVDHLSSEEMHRSRCIWWTVYMLDCKFASSMGAPISARDSDITVELPQPRDTTETFDDFNAHVALTRIFAKILSTIYSANGRLDRPLIKSIQQVLRELAQLSDQMATKFEFRIGESNPTSRVSATLNLFYHQCVVLAIRPILVHLLEDLLKVRRHTVQELATPIKALLKTAYESASRSLRILSHLQSQHLLETFLPFDLEQTFSSAFVLTLMSALPGHPHRLNEEYVHSAFKVIDAMIHHGNVVARFRREDLQELQKAMSQCLVEIHGSDDTPREARDEDTTITSREAWEGLEADYNLSSDQFPNLHDSLDMESDQMTYIDDFLSWEPAVLEHSANQLATDWLWAHTGTGPIAE